MDGKRLVHTGLVGGVLLLTLWLMGCFGGGRRAEPSSTPYPPSWARASVTPNQGRTIPQDDAQGERPTSDSALAPRPTPSRVPADKQTPPGTAVAIEGDFVSSPSLGARWPLPQRAPAVYGAAEDARLWRFWLRMYVQFMGWGSAHDKVILWIGERPPAFPPHLPAGARICGGYEVQHKATNQIYQTGIFFSLSEENHRTFQSLLETQGWRMQDDIWRSPSGDQRITFLPPDLVHWVVTSPVPVAALPPQEVQAMLARDVSWATKSDRIWTGSGGPYDANWTHRVQLVSAEHLGRALDGWSTVLRAQGWHLRASQKAALAQWQQWEHPAYTSTTLIVLAAMASPSSPTGLLHLRAGSSDLEEQRVRLESQFGVPEVMVQGRTEIDALREMAEALLMASGNQSVVWLNPNWLTSQEWLPATIRGFAVQWMPLLLEEEKIADQWIVFFNSEDSWQEVAAELRKRFQQDLNWQEWDEVAWRPPTRIWRWESDREGTRMILCPMDATAEDLEVVLWETGDVTWGWMVYRQLDWFNICEAPQPSGAMWEWPRWEVETFALPPRMSAYAMSEITGDIPYVNASFFLRPNGPAFLEWFSAFTNGLSVPVRYTPGEVHTWTLGRNLWTTVWLVPLEGDWAYVEAMLWPPVEDAE